MPSMLSGRQSAWFFTADGQHVAFDDTKSDRENSRAGTAGIETTPSETWSTQHSWQWVKHGWLYSDLLQVLKGQHLSALGSQSTVPHCREEGRRCEWHHCMEHGESRDVTNNSDKSDMLTHFLQAVTSSAHKKRRLPSPSVHAWLLNHQHCDRIAYWPLWLLYRAFYWMLVTVL